MTKIAVDAARQAHLLTEIHEGNTDAEQELLNGLRIPARVETLIKRRLKIDGDDLAEMVAGVLSTLLSHLRDGQFDSGKASVGQYAWQIASHAIRDAAQTKGPDQQHSAGLTDAQVLTRHYVDVKNEQREILLKCVRQLAPKYREVIVARYSKDLNVEEIAEEMALTPTQTYSRIHYALDLLRGQMKGMYNDGR